MLYDQLKHADTIRKLYRLRHLLARPKPPEVGTRLGYPKYSKQFYRIKSKLRSEGVIDDRGIFVESPNNMHVVIMPLHVDREQIRVLGRRVPYFLFLALSVGPPRRVAYLARECRFSRKAVYEALKSMVGVGLVRMEGYTAEAEDGSARKWLEKYLAAAEAWVDTSGDVSVLFKVIPSYMGGPHVRRILDFEPGTPMGPADVHIFTYDPFISLMKSIVRNSLYFKRHARHVLVRPVGDVQARWIDGVPYQKYADGVGG